MWCCRCRHLIRIGSRQSRAESEHHQSTQRTGESTQSGHSQSQGLATTTGQRHESSTSNSVGEHQADEHTRTASMHHNQQQQQASGAQQSGTVSDRHQVDASRQDGTSIGQERHATDARHQHNQSSVDQAQERHRTISHQGNRQLGNQLNHTTRESGTTTTIRRNGEGVFQVVNVDIERHEKEFHNILSFEWDKKYLQSLRPDDDDLIKNLHSRLLNPTLVRVFQIVTQKSRTVKSQKLHSMLKLEYTSFSRLYDLIQSFISLRSHIDNDSSSVVEVTDSMITCLRTCSDERTAGDIKFTTQKELSNSLNKHPLDLTEECRVKETEQLLDFFESKRKAFSEWLKEPYSPLLPANTYSGQLFYQKTSEDSDGFFIGAREPMTLRDSLQHMLLVGASGTGKTSRFFIPGILRLQDQHALVIDVDGTIYTQTHQAKVEDGYCIKRLDLISPESSSLFNSLITVSNDAQFDQIIDQCFQHLKGGDNQIFFTGGKAIIKFAISLIRTVSGKELELNPDLIKQLFDCEIDKICLSFPLLHKLTDRLTYETMSQLKPIIERQQLDPLRICFNTCYDACEERYSSFLTFSKNALAPFQNHVFQTIMSGNDDIFDEIKDPSKKVIIYLRVKGTDIPQSKTIIGLFFDHFFRTVKDCVDLKPSAPPPRPTLCFMDEFGQYTIPNFATEMTTVRKFNIALMLAIQSQNQISANYNQQASTILQNCQTKVYLNFDMTDDTPRLMAQTTTKTIRKPDGRGGYIDINESVLSEQQLRDIQPGHAILQWRSEAPVKFELLPPIPKLSELKAQSPTSVSIHSDDLSLEIPEKVSLSNDSLFQVFKSRIIDSQKVTPEFEDYLKAAYFSGHINHLLFGPIQIKPEEIEPLHQMLIFKYEPTPKDLLAINAKCIGATPSDKLESFIKQFNNEAIYSTHHPRALIHLDEFNELYSYHEHYLSCVCDLILNFPKAPPEEIWTRFKSAYEFIEDTNQLMKYFCYHIYYSINCPQTPTEESSCWFRSFDDAQYEVFCNWKKRTQPEFEFAASMDQLKMQKFEMTELRAVLLTETCHLGVDVWLSFNFVGMYQRNYVLHKFNCLKQKLSNYQSFDMAMQNEAFNKYYQEFQKLTVELLSADQLTNYCKQSICNELQLELKK